MTWLVATKTLIERQLREETQRWLPYALRVLVVIFILFVIALAQRQFDQFAAPGLKIFTQITYLNFAVLTILGLKHFTGALHMERASGTMDLLRLTRLTPFSILLGSSIGRLTGVMLLTGTQIPFACLAMTLGGLYPEQIITAYLALLGYAILLSQLCLLSSVLLASLRAAITTVLVILILFGFGFWALNHMLHGLIENGWLLTTMPAWGHAIESVAAWCWFANPVPMLMDVFRPQFNEIWFGQPLIHAALGLGCFALSWLSFERFITPVPGNATKVEAKRIARQSETGLDAKPRPSRFAVAWREFYFQLGGLRSLFLPLAAAPVVMLVIGIYVKIDDFTATFSFNKMGILCMAAGAVITFERLATGAAGMFRSEKDAGTLDILSLLPKPLLRIVGEKVFAIFVSSVSGQLLILWGALLSFDSVVRYLVSAPTTVFAGGFALLAIAVVALSLITWVSLCLERGAKVIGIAAAAGAVVVLSWIPQEARLACYLICGTGALGVALVLQSKTYERLETFIEEA